jgi:hypothetical protein
MLSAFITFGAILLAATCFVIDFGAIAFYILNSIFFICGTLVTLSSGRTAPTTLDMNVYIALSLFAGATLNTVFSFFGFVIWAAGVKYFVTNFMYDDMLRVLNSLPFMTDVADIIEGLE